MNTTTADPTPHKLTSKGQATRARILEHAAELIYTKGVHATNNEQLRRAAGMSGSQLNHYFPTKGELVLAVVEWQTELTSGMGGLRHRLRALLPGGLQPGLARQRDHRDRPGRSHGSRHLLLSAHQGGMLLARVARDAVPLTDACWRPSTTCGHSQRRTPGESTSTRPAFRLSARSGGVVARDSLP